MELSFYETGSLDMEIEPEPQIVELPDFGIEYCRLSNDLCVGCNQLIIPPNIRIMKVVRDQNQNTIFDGKATWYHALCFARLRSEPELNWWKSCEDLPGFKRLCEEDKLNLIQMIP